MEGGAGALIVPGQATVQLLDSAELAVPQQQLRCGGHKKSRLGQAAVVGEN
jgi:hypothetical protein